jgi:predicted RNase H-like HicB family nuclease
MNRIKVILELGKDGYGVYFPQISNVFGFGETVEEAKEDAKTALDFYIEIEQKAGNNLPEILQDGYELDFEFNVDALLKYINGTVSKTAIAKRTGIHPTLMTHYSTGLKKPRAPQRKKIIEGLHSIGRELLAVR